MSGVGRIYRRGKRGIFWVAYYRHGKEIRESSGSVNERIAHRLLTRRISEVAAGKLVGPSEATVTFADLWAGLVRDYEINGRRSIRALGIRHGHLGPYFGERRAVDITPALTACYIEMRCGEGAANASINRELAMMGRAFRLGVRGGLISMAPYFQRLAENNARQGFVEHGDFTRLRALLPDYLQDPVTFLYLSGWRVGEMRTLRWADIEMGSGIAMLRRENSKTRQARMLPLEGELGMLIARAASARRLDCPFVFHNEGTPIGDFQRKSWRKAVDAAGLGHLIVHDLRRTAARNMVRAGVPERVVMEVTGHRTREIFDRYNIVNDADLRQAQERLGEYLGRQPKAGKVGRIG